MLSSEIKLFNHTPCEVASKQETNSTSVLKVVTRVYLALLQDTAPPANINMYPEVDLRESTQPTKKNSKFLIRVANDFQVIRLFVHKHVVFCSLKTS